MMIPDPGTQVYYITKAKVGMARKQFSTLTNDYELTFEAGTEITPVCHILKVENFGCVGKWGLGAVSITQEDHSCW